MPVMQCEVLQGQLWMQHTELGASTSDLTVKKPSSQLLSNHSNSKVAAAVQLLRSPAAPTPLVFKDQQVIGPSMADNSLVQQNHHHHHRHHHQQQHTNNHIIFSNNNNNNNKNDEDDNDDDDDDDGHNDDHQREQEPIQRRIHDDDDDDEASSAEDAADDLHHQQSSRLQHDDPDSSLSSLEEGPRGDECHKFNPPREKDSASSTSGGPEDDEDMLEETMMDDSGDESDVMMSPLNGNGRHRMLDEEFGGAEEEVEEEEDDVTKDVHDDLGEKQQHQQGPTTGPWEPPSSPSSTGPPASAATFYVDAESNKKESKAAAEPETPEPERRNKRKNFKPRSIVYHQYEQETVRSEFLPDYANNNRVSPNGTAFDDEPGHGGGPLVADESSATAAVAATQERRFVTTNMAEDDDDEDDEDVDDKMMAAVTVTSAMSIEPSTERCASVTSPRSESSMTDSELDIDRTSIRPKVSVGSGDQPLDLSDNANNNNNGSVKRTLSSSSSSHHQHRHQRHTKDTNSTRTDLGQQRTLGTTPMDLSFGRGGPALGSGELEGGGGGGRGETESNDLQECDVIDLSKGQHHKRRRGGGEGVSSVENSPRAVEASSSATSRQRSVSPIISTAVSPSLAALSASLLGVQHAAALGYAQAIRDGHHSVEDNDSASASGGQGGTARRVRSVDGLPHLPPGTTVDASAMKDYAESTMKELLGLFGLNDMSESITKDVPLPNFSSVKILENMSSTLGLMPSSSASQLPSTSLSSTLHAQSSTMMSTSSSGANIINSHMAGTTTKLSGGSRLRPSSATMTTSTTSAAASTSTSATTSSSSPSAHLNHEDLYESLHSQVVDSMTKLASLPSNNLIGNPRVILPHNINTILTLAALQKQQKPSPSSPPPPSSSSPSPVASSSSKMTPARLLSPSSSVLAPGGSGAPLNSTSLFRDHHGKSAPVDYARYVKRYFNKFSSALECGSSYCKDLNYREHFHCMDCNSRVFIKKEEMIRHFKWHKKRDESLQHGFLRYSPMDDCTDRFRNCPHNRKQTHYHCIKETCDKVYISTSDVQMHANYHRKDSAIIQEGFQRFRATEDCATSYCAFAGQRTTHFHCRRSPCNFTFKNKADMEKHKTYHIKDEQLNKDGFKKFMKHEPCSYDNCRFSRVCNHIHCIRQGCSYVLHSSGQLYSHKRKHERRDNEMAYRKFKLAQSMMRSLGENQLLALQSFNDEMKGSESNQMHGGTGNLPVLQTPSGSSMSMSTLDPASAHSLTPDSTTANYTEALQQSFAKYSSFLAASAGGSMHLDPNISPHGFLPGMDQFMMMDLNAEFLKARSEEIWKKYCSRFTANDPCKPHCDLIYKDHYHCNTESCSMVFRSKDGVRDHARCHEQQDQVTEAFFTTVEAGQTGACFGNCPHQGKEKHYHCGWQSCLEVIMATDKPFRRLDHYKMHEYSHKMSMAKDPLGLSLASSAFDGIFKRKRGRPPKNRVVEFPISSGASELPQAIYTSFKLLKPNNVPVSSRMDNTIKTNINASNTGDVMPSTSRNIHPKPSSSPVASSSSASGHLELQTKVEILDGFYVFPEGLSCPSQPGCPYTGQLHYHCTRPRCFYVTDRSDILVLHSKDFHDNIEIAEGFAFFDRNVNCRLPGCQSNQVTRHFHCTRPHCNYSFVRFSTMSMHERKHQDMAAIDRFFNSGGDDDDDDDEDDDDGGGAAVNAPPQSTAGRKPQAAPQSSVLHHHHHHQQQQQHQQMMTQTPTPIKQEFNPTPSSTPTPPTTMSDSRTPSPGGSSNGGKTSVVKAAGTYYPLSAFPHPYHTNKDADKLTKVSCATEMIKGEPPSAGVAGSNESIDLRTLAESHVAYSTERSCGRPFCKLKRKDHVHCTFCNQGFTQLSHLQPHIQKHLSGSSSPSATLEQLPSASNRRQPATTSDDDFSDRQEDDDGSETISEPGDKHHHQQQHRRRRSHRVNNDELTSDDESNSHQSHHVHHALHQSHNQQHHQHLQQQLLQQQQQSYSRFGVDNMLQHGSTSMSKRRSSPSSPGLHQPLSQHSVQQQAPPLTYSASFLATSAASSTATAASASSSNPVDMLQAFSNCYPSLMTSSRPPAATSLGLQTTAMGSGNNCAEDVAGFSAITMHQRNGNPEFQSDTPSPSSKMAALQKRDTVDSDSSDSDRDDDDDDDDDDEDNNGRSNSPGVKQQQHRRLHQQRKKQRCGKRSSDSLDADYADTSAVAKKQAKLMLQQQQQQLHHQQQHQQQTSSMRILKDEPVPTGYVRYRFNEDCRYTHCGYREHQTHFHCVRPDCGYSFCDKTRFVQHTARHERLDTLMGGDFQQFRANVPCGRPACVYTLAPGSLANKASHFHCLKCEFVCTDTNKVVAHRRQHQKLDSIMAAGFEKFTAVQPCQLDGCAYNQRQTHYHCTKCQYAVLGLSQMSSHKFRHLEG